HFTVKPGADGEGQFTLDGFTDGLAGSTTSPATFHTKAGPGDEWDVSPDKTLYEYSKGDLFSVDLMLSGDGEEIDALGLDIMYPDDLLHFNDYNFNGTMMSAWNFKDVANLGEGNLRMAGFTTSGMITAAGKLVTLNFTVEDINSGSGQICLMNFTDDIADATSSCATVEITEPSAIRINPGHRPSSFALYPNYPNPFNPFTTICFDMPVAGDVRIDIFDIKGNHICSLMSGHMDAGAYNVTWNAIDKNGHEVAAGIYLYRFAAGSFRAIRKMTLLK
ncbi:hypothetical protein JXB12_07085, partial [candidate division KSB1 bacterium]|nr:hypothetical protein [candidate division KSB1 bacterium]